MIIEDAHHLTWSDIILERTFLRLIPKSWRPNYITTLRLLATPLVSWLLWDERYAAGLICFVVIAFTDALDGAMARTRHQITEWGKMFDPLADKFLICSSVIILMIRFLEPLVAILTLILELTIILGAMLKRHSGRTIQANGWGKAKMLFQVLGVSLILLHALFYIPVFQSLGVGFFYMAIGLGAAGLFTYSI